MDWVENGHKLNKSERHKSWYKVDIDGDFITKNQVEFIPRKKLSQLILKKPNKVNTIFKANSEILNATDCEPKTVANAHQTIFKLSIHFCISILMLLTAYCGFSYVLPTKVVLVNLSYIIREFKDTEHV